MNLDKNYILTLDLSSNSIKAALITEDLTIESTNNNSFIIINEDIDGFAKRFDMDNLVNNLILCIKNLIQNKDINLIGISSCAQRIATVFIDNEGNVIYGGPNTDLRGIDSAYIIEDEFSEDELFKITGHTPSLLFPLARLLWFKEEESDLYEKISKVLMLDDWLVYFLSGNICSDISSSAESQFIDIRKRSWSSEIIQSFDLEPDFFPKIVESGTIIGELKPELTKKFGIKGKAIPIIKTGGDTQASLLGMGAIDQGDTGITLGTTAPVQLVLDEPKFDPDCNYWSSCHCVPGKWLIEAHSGGTGAAYNWFKESFLAEISKKPDNLVDIYLKNSTPGSLSTYAYLGPENMNIKNQTSIKRGIFIFEPPSMVSEEIPKLPNFAQSVIENIAFGIFENFSALKKFYNTNLRALCAGGMAKSREICKILANVLNTKLFSPFIKDSAFIGAAINILIGLDYFSDYKSVINKLLKFETYSVDASISKLYKNVYQEWKTLKNKIDDI
ncbi:MAG: FGGY-family carbohydrate kinase [Candidatus Heimdallarchaeota archaeon]